MSASLRDAARAALIALQRENPLGWAGTIEALKAALAEKEPEMPSDTRYTVAVEGQAPTYWDNIHDAITNAQRAVYAGADNTWHAINDLQAGRIAEWSYGFSAVRIYPPQKQVEVSMYGKSIESEPVAWMCGGSLFHSLDAIPANLLPPVGDIVPLYTHPPRREWQGLTDDERLDAFDAYCEQTSEIRSRFRAAWSYAEEELDAFDAGWEAAEAALKEKNA